MRKKLTAKAVARLKAPTKSGKQEVTWDDELRGFGVLLSGVSSTKSYIVQRDIKGGKTRRVTIGNVAEIDLKQARAEAAALIHAMRGGKDPKAKGSIDTLRRALEAYLLARADLRPKSVLEYRRAVERHLEPWLDRPLHEITREMVEERHREIAELVEKGGRYEGKATANHAMRALGVLWNYAAGRIELPANPVKQLRRQWFPVPRRERLIRADELPAFYTAVKALPNPVQRDYLLLLLFTGMRREEAARLRWADVDLAGRIVRLAAASTKSGRKLDLPMSTFVRDLLVARRAIGGGEFVFPANSKSGHITEPKFPLKLIADATGIKVSVHDLRRTFITVAESSDISPLALKMLVNHSLGRDVTSGYIVPTVDRLREPAQRVCDRMMELCQIPELEGAERLA
jgi:integrase